MLLNRKFILNLNQYHSNATLVDHRVSNLEETSNVGTKLIVLWLTILLSSLLALSEDLPHDFVEFFVNLLSTPLESHRVLGHFQTRGRNTASVGSLAWSEEDLALVICVDGIIVRWHVGTFRDISAALGDDTLGLFTSDFVLGGAWHDDVDVAFEDLPWAFALEELGSLGELKVVRASTALDILNFHDLLELFSTETILFDDGTVRVRE